MDKRKLLTVLLELGFLVPQCLPAAVTGSGSEPVTAILQANTDTALIGDLIDLDLTVHYPRGYEVHVPGASDQLGVFEVRDYRLEEPQTGKDDSLVLRARYLVATFETGDQEIPSLEVTWWKPATSAAGGDEQSIRTNSITIRIESLLDEGAEDVRDIKPPVEIPATIWSYWPWLAALAALAMLGYGYQWLRGRQHPDGVVASTPLLPPDEEALASLQRLLELDLLRKGRVKLFYIEISDIIRRYIHRRWGIPARELTTAEILRALDRQPLGTEPRRLCGRFLRRCDLVKFAKYRPSDVENDTIVEWVRQMIEMTRPKPVLESHEQADPVEEAG